MQSDELLEQFRQHLGITWIYEINHQQVQPSATASAGSALIAPPAEELKALYAAARIGDIDSVEQEAQRLAQLNVQYQAFAQQLLQFAQAMDDEAILRLVKQQVEPVT